MKKSIRGLLNKRFYASITPENPKLIQANDLLSKGINAVNENNLKSAKSFFENSLKAFETSDAAFNLGNVCHLVGDEIGSVKNWKKSLELASPRADALVNIANVFALKKDLKSSIEYYQKAVKLEPEDGQIFYNLAVVLDNDGQLEKAIENYQIALSFGIIQAENTLRNARARWASALAKTN